MAKAISRLSDILNRLMFEKKIRATELAREVDLPQPTVHRIVTGKCANPHQSSLQPLANYFDITVDQLKGNSPLPKHLFEAQLPTHSPEARTIPIIHWEDATHNLQNITTDENIIAHQKLSLKCFALYMNDSSMEPQFSVGTTLIFDPDREAKDRSFVLVKLSKTEKPIFRQLLIDGTDRFLKPLNPDLVAFKMRILSENDKIIATLVEARQHYEEF